MNVCKVSTSPAPGVVLQKTIFLIVLFSGEVFFSETPVGVVRDPLSRGPLNNMIMAIITICV